MKEQNYNRGEWSEAYLVLKVLGDGKLKSGNNVSDDFYPILKIIRNEDSLIYNIIHDDDINYESEYIYIQNFKGEKIKEIKAEEFKDKYRLLLDKIKKGKGRTFSIPEIKKYMDEIGIENIKSGSNNKSDINLEIRDLELLKNKILDFSIKSFLGSSPTILNSSNNTNFRYEVKDIDVKNMEIINNINKENNGRSWLKDRIRYIRDNYEISFDKMLNATYKNNFNFIDTNLDIIVSDLLLEFYSTKRLSSIDELIKKIAENNILNISSSNKRAFYKRKIIELIKASSFGMMPNSEWDGNYDVDGGMIIIFNDGSTKMYHLHYEKEEINQIFLKETKLDTPSTSRYKMGNIYIKDGKYYFNLNVQIRYK